MGYVYNIRMDGLEHKMRQFVEEFGRRVVSKARDNVPLKTGLLYSSIYYEVIDDNTGIVGASVPYASHIEFGTFNIVRAAQRRGFNVGVPLEPDNPITVWQAQVDRGEIGTSMPFLRPAFFTVETEIPDILEELRE